MSGSSDQRFLQLFGKVTGANATTFHLQFDVEAWDAKDGTWVETLRRYVGAADSPGEAAFGVVIDVDSGDGFQQLWDGAVITGATLRPVIEGIVDGNDDANRVSFDSGVITAPIPAGSNFRIRWTPDTQAQSTGWVFGLDNVSLALANIDVEGDFNQDGFADVFDLDALITEVRAGTNNLSFDLNDDGIVDNGNRTIWVTDIKNTFIGDTNLDGSVNALDLNALALNWRSTTATSSEEGDFNGDGNVNALDLNDLALSWRSGVAAAASAPAVPEPSSIALLLLGGFSVLRSRRRRNR